MRIWVVSSVFVFCGMLAHLVNAQQQGAPQLSEAAPIPVSNSQPWRINQPRQMVTIGLAAAAAKTSLTPAYQYFSPVFSIALQLNRKKLINGCFTLSIGQVSGYALNPTFNLASAPNATPNVTFKTTLISLHYEAQLNLLKRKNYTLFFAQGFGLLRFAPQDNDGNNLAAQASSRAPNETYATITTVFPTSFGFRAYLPNQYALGIQAGWYNTSTQYLDNIGKLAPNGNNGNDNIAFYRFTLSIPINAAKASIR